MYAHYITRSFDYSSCILCRGNMIVLESVACGWCVLVHPVPMLTADRSCLSLLLGELFMDAFTLFPGVLFELVALI
jgi:hypothetical protein